MTVFGRLLAKLTGAKPEARFGGAAWGDYGLGPLTTGHGMVSARLAENLAVVTACVEVISGTLSTLPAIVYRRLPEGREEAPRHPVSSLIRRPNSRQTWPDWLAMTMSSVLLHGNALSIIDSDEAGRPCALIPVPWQNVMVSLTTSGRLAFDLLAMVAPWGGTGEPRRLFEDEVFLLKGRSDDGYLGRSVLSRAPSVVHAAEGAQTFATSIWHHAAAPSGVLKHPGKLSKDAKAFLADDFNKKNAGAHNARRIPILDEGMEFVGLSLSAEDSELLESRRFSGEELARLFAVPPPLIGDLSHGSFTNVETAARFFATLCLSPWARRIEAEFQRSVFTDDNFHLLIDLAGLLRGDEVARWATYATAIDKGILTVNEIRALEGWNPRPEADEIEPGAQPP